MSSSLERLFLKFLAALLSQEHATKSMPPRASRLFLPLHRCKLRNAALMGIFLHYWAISMWSFKVVSILRPLWAISMFGPPSDFSRSMTELGHPLIRSRDTLGVQPIQQQQQQK
ncbi:unnamed protein product [Polarella glacialis]|uniref:Uncharacterized protein n=1 Tax=Polarella glacialis TaxID=89957 RepID=A0A813GZ13_POLGL|nr:unnamed protein product [Polarella glacialis]